MSERPEELKMSDVPHPTKLKMGIVGHGFVGKAVDYAFTHVEIEKFYVDPKYGTTIDDLLEWEPNITFVCAPTPMSESGFVDASIVEDAVLKLLEHTRGGVVVKSTITPDIVDRIYSSVFEDDLKRLTINPEFLTESANKEQFVMAKYHIIGGHPDACQGLAQFYEVYSLCTANEYVFMSGVEAAFVKYGVNSYLATKVTFFNQAHEIYKACGGKDFDVVIDGLCLDPRVGRSHTQVPGPDGLLGYGGHCFPKDMAAFAKFGEDAGADVQFLKDTIDANTRYRS